MKILDILNMDGTTTQQVKIDNPDGSYVMMTKDIYDAQIAVNSTLPSNSSTPQAGA